MRVFELTELFNINVNVFDDKKSPFTVWCSMQLNSFKASARCNLGQYEHFYIIQPFPNYTKLAMLVDLSDLASFVLQIKYFLVLILSYPFF